MVSDGESNQKSMKSGSKKLMNISNMLKGVYLCLKNAEDFFKISEELLNNKKYQAAIPIATISIEEAMKGLELLRKIKHNQSITVDDWNNLKNHKHKLTNTFQWALTNLKNMDDNDLDKTKRDLSQYNLYSENDLDTSIRNLKHLLAIYSHFQNLREICFYSSWNKQGEKWIIFDELTEEKQEVLAFFIVTESQIRLNLLKKFIERFVNEQRKNKQLLFKLPYPSYTDYKPPKKMESSKLPVCPQTGFNQLKYKRGLEFMKLFISLNSFQFSFGIFCKIMHQYRQVMEKQKGSELSLHPMISAIMIAIFKINESTDGYVLAISGDADQTNDGTPKISFAAVVKKESDICKLVEIKSLLPTEKTLTTDMIEKIIRTEIIIERNAGNTIPINLCIEALSNIGIKCKMIKQSEISNAIRATKKSIRQNSQIHSKEFIDKINVVKGTEEWWDLSSELKSTIVTVYGREEYPKYNVYLTPSTCMPKFECRRLIFNILSNKYLPTA